jgi:hypothetical protein
MRSDQLTGDQVEAIAAKVRPALRYLHKLAGRMDHVLDPQDELRLKTIKAANSLQYLLTELHYLTVDPGKSARG